MMVDVFLNCRRGVGLVGLFGAGGIPLRNWGQV